ncbi:hypothetical protein PV396_20215 [Streptomyces sp. ME02-8801-2C]|uniref:hypothetical protein n=1 Tax=Streptomyces sp. ME02-8801-2C TaxID=3028680 RepID=UPI0029B009BE|nr:hypothetical protein [Streptomyces sp. ME02-8801-2C]MDX3454242.1 hypothetical protein [Streptomyces sp. ME02-8801-2C]
MRASSQSLRLMPVLAAALLLWTSGVAHADLPGDHSTTPPPATPPTGGADGNELYASASYSNIKVTQVSGPTGGKRGALAAVNTTWTPPPCWYEPGFTPEQLKTFSETVAAGNISTRIGWYGSKLWTDFFRDGKSTFNYYDTTDGSGGTVKGFDDYNVGKKGYFWRGVAADTTDPFSWDCNRIMFWEPAGVIPKIAHAPTPKTLAEYAYDKIEVPSTEIELRPTAKSTVNLPTWVWLDKGTFQDIKVRAELPNTGLWAETTAKPVALHLDPGTADAATYPPSGDCTINEDGSIGTPYTAAKASEAPPCGITYLRATDGTPYQLKASVTWEITWQGSDGTGDRLPNGTFETTQDIAVQEIQSVNR